MAIARRISGGDGGAVAVLVVLVMLTNCVNAQIYQCWGGCFNQCFLSSSESRPDGLACYYQCLSGCIPRSANGYRYYCQIGCSLDICRLIPYNDGARMEQCFDGCSNRCRAGRI